MSKMIDYLPKYERNSKVINEILNSCENELNNRNIEINDIYNQLSISSATWALDVYEKSLDIKTDLSKSYEERRSVIKSKLRGTGKVDKELIKLVVDSFTNGNVDVGFDGEIKVIFNDVKGVPPNINDVHSSIDNIKPAHLNVYYKFAYLLIKDIHNNMTVNELENTKINKLAFNEVI